MYTFTREVTFKTMIDALRGAPIAQAFAKYYQDAHGVTLRLSRPVTGAPTRLRFTYEMESIDASQALTRKAAMDPAFHKLLAEIGPLVDGSKTRDEIWQ